MRIDIATLFPQMCGAVLGESIVGRGIKNGFIEIYTHDIRAYTEDKHNRVDDKPYGGGTGMVMQAQPIFDCIAAICAQHKTRPRVIYMSPQGQTLTQAKVKELAAEQGLVLLCGHYEGVDQRVLDELCAEEISVGDYVLTGGELPALILADAVARLQKGVLPNEDAYSIESHEGGLLEYPQYTRPEVWRGREVPQTLLSGDHRTVSAWQHSAALRVTAAKRPDMFAAHIKAEQERFWREFAAAKQLPEDTPHAFRCFGADEESARAQAKLVMRGKKRAAVRAKSEYEAAGEPLPKRGGYTVITDIYGEPLCVVQTFAVHILRADELPQDLMLREDGSAEAWRENHAGLCGETLAAAEEFRLVYKRPAARKEEEQ